jgi:hypothetical protein
MQCSIHCHVPSDPWSAGCPRLCALRRRGDFYVLIVFIVVMRRVHYLEAARSVTNGSPRNLRLGERDGAMKWKGPPSQDLGFR